MGEQAQTIKVKCARCAGSGRVFHRTSRVADGRCFCCCGAGHYFRKPATKRVSAAERLAAQLAADNARLRELFPHVYDSEGRVIRAEEAA